MGRAIDMENDISVLKKEMEQLKTAFSGLADTVDSLKNTATTKKHVDLHEKPLDVETPKKTKKKVTEKFETAV